MANIDLSYTDSVTNVTGRIVLRNRIRHLHIIIATNDGNSSEQYIPLEFLANFDRYMFNAVFKTL